MGNKPVIGIIGCGLMGSSLAVLFTGNGYQVKMLSYSDESLGRGVRSYEAFFNKLVEANVLTEGQMNSCHKLLVCTTAYEDLYDAEFVIETVLEDLDLKHKIYSQIEANCSADTIILSATSGILPDALSSEAIHPERILVSHPWNPPHLVPCIEVVTGSKNTQEIIDRTVKLYTDVKREAVVLEKAAPGFIGNRIMHAMYREATYIVEQGIATPEQIDKVIMSSFGPRYGSIGMFEHFDLVGLDLIDTISGYLYPTLCDAHDSVPTLKKMAESGNIGHKSGTGYLDWREKDMDDFRTRQLRPYLSRIDWDIPIE